MIKKISNKVLMLFCFFILLIGQASALTNFNSTWNTSKISTGSSNVTEIKLPLELAGTYNFTVWWGDGSSDNITTYNQTNVTHNYSTAGIYNLVIDGTLYGFRFNNVGDRLKLIDITQWGNMRVGNSNGYFYGASNFNSTASDQLDLTGTTTMYCMFYSATVFNQNISAWNVSKVTIMNYMFRSATAFNQNIGAWNTSSVTTMTSMFNSATAFNQNISSWDVSKVTTTEGMFYSATVFNQNLGTWNVSKVTTMSYMFLGVTLSTSNYDGILNGWTSLPSLNISVLFHGGNSKYSLVGEYSRNNTLNGTYGWVITDGGLEAENLVTSLHYNATQNYFHRVQSNGTLYVDCSVIAVDATGWTANSTNSTYNTYWIFTTAITPPGNTNFTISGKVLDNFTVYGLTALTQYDVKNTTTIGSFTTDGAGNATFETDLVAGDYTILQTVSVEENTSPLISNVVNGSVNDTWGIINFTVNQTNAITNIKYSTDLTLNLITNNLTSGLDRSVNISNLNNDTKYYYSVFAYNNSNNSYWSNSSIQNFTTLSNISISLPKPNITSWNNSNTSNNNLSLTVLPYTNITFYVLSNQSNITWYWTNAFYINGSGANESYAYTNLSNSLNINVYGINENGITQIITWNINVITEEIPLLENNDFDIFISDLNYVYRINNGTIIYKIVLNNLVTTPIIIDINNIYYGSNNILYTSDKRNGTILYKNTFGKAINIYNLNNLNITKVIT